MDSSKGIYLGKKNRFSNAQDYNHENYEEYKESIKRTNQKELTFFFLNELIGEYGYKSVINSLDKIPSERNPESPLDITIQLLIEKLGKDIIQENIYYYRNLDVSKFKNKY